MKVLSFGKTASVGAVQLRKFMNEAVTPAELAERFDVSVGTVYKWGRGELIPPEHVQIVLNRLLGVVNDWLDDEGQYIDLPALEVRGL